MKFDEAVDYVSPILAVMDQGDYDTARQMLQEVPEQDREQVRMTIAARTQALL
ncbi:hypothetical protein Ep4_028 [Pseudomonas phage Ep4]|uniref:Uncharacterized protein n=1 Tax=Pseudomonas phage Ep4 TaxID=3057492 RepID=A0AAU9ELK3_9CAUD|nr:hypothetical protein Ep4_028 [Pseudomonas phage Ep4]